MLIWRSKKMPLIHDDTDDSRNKNIEQLVKDGYGQKQAAAIAYAIQKKSKVKSAAKGATLDLKTNIDKRNKALEDIYNW